MLFEQLHILENLIAIENGIGLRKTLAAMVLASVSAFTSASASASASASTPTTRRTEKEEKA